VLNRLTAKIKVARKRKAFLWAWALHATMNSILKRLQESVALKIKLHKQKSAMLKIEYGARKWLNKSIRRHASKSLRNELYMHK